MFDNGGPMYCTDCPDTLILPPGDHGPFARIPKRPGSTAALQFLLLSEHPYRHTSEDIVARVAGWREAVSEAEFPDFYWNMRARPHFGLEASPLVTLYGWAIHTDEQCRAALVDPASADFAALLRVTPMHITTVHAPHHA
ncbi:DUF6157 family protein [Aliiroseovarius sp. PTFE2010]|uniref:DUF6157 family protein n=1 Tax=Aliiroseovarius sp. PTFE2010 TaxID=3417190 RepID=UPI003CF855F0